MFRKRISHQLYVSLKIEKIMKANYITTAACILALAACSKAELGEGVSAPKGETVTLSVSVPVPSPAPQTRAALDGDGDILKFEGDETIYAVASNGSTATLTAQDNSGKFAGTFSAPVTDGSTISLYCHNVEGTTTFAQNGKPWLQSLGNSFTRTEDRKISLTATLAAPAGVRAVAFITDGTDIESLEFHTKSGAKFTTFNGSTFDGEAVSTQKVVKNRTGYTNSTIFNVPDGLEGGYWIKAVKGGQSMYKSYSSSTAVTENSRIEVKEFVPASVKLDVQLSGFPTSYSWYVANEEGSGVTSKDVAKANATANDWIGAGKATYTITREGIPSTLLKFESFKLTVDGMEKTETESDKTITYDGGNGHTTWGQKDIVATVTYTNLATGATETASKTVTRHITGLPYKNVVPSNSGSNKWNVTAGSKKVKFESDGVTLGSSGTETEDPRVSSPAFHVPSSINVASDINYILTSHKVGITYHAEFYMYIAGSQVIKDKSNSTSGTTYNKTVSGALSNSSNTIEFRTDTRTRLSGNAKVKKISLLYK